MTSPGPIPRVFHYCWFGGTEPDDEMRRCLATWSALHPEAELVRWDEGNVQELTDDPFVERALTAGRWSRASNAVRVHALRRHGGVYLDTDVELLARLDHLFGLAAFLGFQYEPDGTPVKPFDHCVNGAIIGARAGHPFLDALLDELPRDRPDEEAFAVLGPAMITRALIAAGLGERPGGGTSDQAVTVAGVTVLPRWVFYPWFHGEPPDPAAVRTDTLAIHHWAKRW